MFMKLEQPLNLLKVNQNHVLDVNTVEDCKPSKRNSL